MRAIGQGIVGAFLGMVIMAYAMKAPVPEPKPILCKKVYKTP